MRHAPVGIFTLPAVGYALQRYARLKTHYRVPVEARDMAAKYLCFKLQERAFVIDLNERFSVHFSDEVATNISPTVVSSKCQSVVKRLKSLFFRQRD